MGIRPLYIYIYLLNVKDVSCDGIKINLFSKEKLKAALYLPPAEWPAKIGNHVRYKRLVHFCVSVIWMYKKVPLEYKTTSSSGHPSESGVGKIRSKKITSSPQPIIPVLLQHITQKKFRSNKIKQVK